MKIRQLVFLLVIIAVLLAVPAIAQCPMCKASVESSLKEGSRAAAGINKGILYLLMMPYLLFSSIFLLWYRHYRRQQHVVER
ncbi:MAG: hypothetical protein KatS3mg031_1084 [Chitinophagales bacterium]|nr:MAG: hypothetical protein KatS3mg031_1084 [Chitinophagales bacterium]